MQRASKRVFVKTDVRWPVAGILLLCGCLYVCVCACAYVCQPARLLIITGMMWCEMFSFAVSFCMANIDGIISRCGL